MKILALIIVCLLGRCAHAGEAVNTWDWNNTRDDSHLPRRSLEVSEMHFGSVKGPTMLTIGGPHGALVEVNLDTGKVKVHGNPNEAARAFWRAVEATAPRTCKR